MTEKLKPCPFCGGEPFMVGAEIDGRAHYIVKCTACHSTSGVMQMNRSKAAEAWNRRAERTCHRVMRGLKNAPGFVGGFCSECGHPINEGAVYCEHCGARVVGGDE